MKTLKKPAKAAKKQVIDKDDLWLINHFSELVVKYPGKYVAVANESVAAVGDISARVEEEAKKKYPGKVPSVLHVPREEELVCLL